MRKVAVIGGGASGMMAALRAAEGGAAAVIFEKQKKPGRKILASGNGRCNISNLDITPDRYHGHNPKFVNNVFGRFGLDETRAFFNSIGVPFVEGESGKLYPRSLQASTVTEMLEYELARRKVEVCLHRKIETVNPFAGGFRLITAGREEFRCDAVVLAAGSCAYPQLGASRSGYELAASLGHLIHEPFPSVLPLNIPLKAIHRLQGIKWDCRVEAVEKGRIIGVSKGELLFTEYGISGPAALEISRAVNGSIVGGEAPLVRVDFFPDMGKEDLRNMLETLWRDGAKPAALSLRGILKKRMPEVLLGIAGIDAAIPVGRLSAAERDAATNLFKGLELRPGAPRPFGEAVVAAGGVSTEEVSPVTLESKLVKGLYITGELLDIDGDSGGFNLQFAWSTGALAGMDAARGR